MSALVIKTGMQSEASVATSFAAKGTLILSGVQTLADLRNNPDLVGCKAIISFGLAGGLAPSIPGAPLIVGQTVIADKLVTPVGTFLPDPAWRKRLFAKTKAYEHIWFSSGEFNTANDPESRAAIFQQYGASVIDDESIFVAQYASEKGIPFAILRNISDAARDTVPPLARNALSASGGINVGSIIASLASDPGQIPLAIKTWQEYNTSIAELGTAAMQVGPTFQWE